MSSSRNAAAGSRSKASAAKAARAASGGDAEARLDVSRNAHSPRPRADAGAGAGVSSSAAARTSALRNGGSSASANGGNAKRHDDGDIEMVVDARAGAAARKSKAGGGGLLKKKTTKLGAGYKGGVVELDLDKATAATAGSHGNAAAARTRSQTTSQMAAMDRSALQLAEQSSLATKRSRALVAQTYEVGSATATKLSEQTEQLGRIQDDLIDTNVSLDRADKLIHEIENPFTSKFTPGPKVGKKKENQLKSAKLRADGQFVRTPVDEVPVVQSLDDLISGDNLPTSPREKRSTAKEREALLGGANKKEAARREGEPMSTEERLRQLRQEQDEDIHAIGATVAGLKGMALQMNAELSTQEELIDAVEHDTEIVNRRLQRNTRKVKALK